MQIENWRLQVSGNAEIQRKQTRNQNLEVAMKFILCRSLIALTVIMAVPMAYASTIDTVTLTPNGSNTNFTIAGVYGPGTPTTSFSAPNTPYLVSFTLATTPDPASFDFILPFGIFGVTTGVTVNNVNFAESEVLFFETGLGGGFNLCLDDACVDTNTVCDMNGCIDGNPPSANSWAIYSDQFFTGTIYDPTFISGIQEVIPNESYVSITQTPEPESMALFGTGLLGLGPLICRRARRKPDQLS
jgi:PEP-CTERM motif